jgi:hypothetical protein
LCRAKCVQCHLCLPYAGGWPGRKPNLGAQSGSMCGTTLNCCGRCCKSGRKRLANPAAPGLCAWRPRSTGSITSPLPGQYRDHSTCARRLGLN